MRSVIFTHQLYQPGKLFPFSLTTAVEEIPAGMMTNRRRWELIVEKELQQGPGLCWFIPANLLPSRQLIAQLKTFSEGDFLQLDPGGVLIGYGRAEADFSGTPVGHVPGTDLDLIEYGWDIFEKNARLLHFDFELLTAGRQSAPANEGNRLSTAGAVFIEEGADVRYAFINADEGPVYISKNALVMEGTCIRGPVFIGERAVVKMGTRIYGASSIGAYCTVGGEIKNSVLFPFSNKAHDGYLGDSVIGSWCNLGAGTSNSNLKNTAGNIRITLPSGLYRAGMKCGVLMGDYSKAAINTSFNSGTVTGICTHIFGAGLTPKWIPSFSWGYNTDTIYDLPKALEHLERWMQTKKQTITENEKALITHIYNQTKTKKS
ncbi:putative sugar nucleotidyl transferase [Niabella drilacis]|uniref:UDP-N-acetylglucosamine diphosphorylase/glucosamine-1-phosphate N-acetyltransferase n=1 Tax=Niabella drilacis (strain DSM 25811 / CCM 8410 / CCUG 62505 / LMG 26954 / E90) TaxID=1285928 RepID=A0A1G6YDM0_NIADE|nr:putative sugar nucleotidyl transferase [Niabella drilacis]SDD87686.1 UDP-N-acetylglucosamine diphosphorylase/glucosamine-1-phosphate N-acetyltransferase [Niabella drilacis]